MREERRSSRSADRYAHSALELQPVSAPGASTARPTNVPLAHSFNGLTVLEEIIVSQRITSLDNQIRLITPQDNCLGVFFIEL